MGFADIAGLDFLDGVLDKDNLIETAKVMAGGTAGGVAYGYLAKQSFLGVDDGGTTALLKRLGAGFALALVGGMGLDRMGQPGAAKGFIGAVGGQVGAMLGKKYAPSVFAGYDQGYYLGDSASSFVQFNGLASTRVLTDDNLPANLGRVSVSQPDPAELASLMSAF